jgi:6,7-dimethyl-8-ribityllumazine synthase
MAATETPFELEPGSARGIRVLIVEARFYGHIADELLAGAQEALARAGATYEVVTVPGALEIPAAIALAVEHTNFRCFVALGTVIRGETTHYDIVAGESARALIDLSVDRGIALGNGILTVETEEQALARADRKRLDKGGGAAVAAVAMALLERRLRGTA